MTEILSFLGAAVVASVAFYLKNLFGESDTVIVFIVIYFGFYTMIKLMDVQKEIKEINEKLNDK